MTAQACCQSCDDRAAASRKNPNPFLSATKSTVIYYGGLFLCHKMLNNKNFRLLRYIVPPLWNYSAAEMVRFTVTSVFDIAVIVKQPHSDNTPYEKIGDEVRSLADEVPFDIPDSWEWVRLGNIGDWGAGATPSRTNPEYYGGNIPWLKTGDLTDSYIDAIPETITELALEKTSVRLNPAGSVLIAMYGATIGKLGILSIAATTNQACCACFPLGGLDNKYLFYFLMAQKPLFIKQGEGGAQPNISKEKIVSTLMPVPPLEEQRRIVVMLGQIFPIIDAYSKCKTELDLCNATFPERLKKSILQEAVQGKLVPQDPSDEPAEALLERIRTEKQRLIKEGKIKKDKHESVIFRRDNSHYEKLGGVERCIDDELPFEIAENWSWPRIPTISLSISAGGDKPSVFSKVKTEKCSVPVSALQCIVSICTTIITWFCSLQNLFLPQSRWVVFCGFERKIETKLEIKLFLWYNDYKAKEVFK